MDSGLVYILYVFSSAALVKAAAEFSAIRYGRTTLLPSDEQTFFGNAPKNVSEEQSITGIITYVAGFASDAATIDPLLDEMRIMTATRDPGPFTVPEQEKLAHIYYQLEHYLVDIEPVRRYSREELHALIKDRFESILANNQTFNAVAIGAVAPGGVIRDEALQ